MNENKKIKVALILERANVALGGAERSIFELRMALSALGLEVIILAAKGGTDSKKIKILCQNKPGKRVGFHAFKRALKKHLAQNPYDIIHSVLPFNFADVYQPRGGSFVEAVNQNAQSYQNKLLTSCKKTTAFANYRRTIMLRAEKKLCRKSKGPLVLALSRYVAEQFRKHYDLAPERIVILPNGVKTNKPVDSGQADKLRAQILAQLHLKEADNPVFFLFVANNFRLKGLSSLIKAMHLALPEKTDRKPYLVVAGSAPTHKYRSLAKKCRVQNKIIFIGPVRKIQNALAITDVAVLPTFYDPSSRFILEALAAQKPVITTTFNGATDMFVANRHGKVIDTPENITALAQAISYFTDTENIQKASRAIVEDNIKEKISISNVAKSLESLYEQILEKRRFL
jgi:UDP-glucose:(heptosyl)LPS alpha-1,3-glucosyltransferase